MNMDMAYILQSTYTNITNMFRQTNGYIAFYDTNTVYDILKFKAPDPKMITQKVGFAKWHFLRVNIPTLDRPARI